MKTTIEHIQIPRAFLKLEEGTKFTDVVVYATLINQMDYNTYTSTISVETISEKYNIPTAQVKRAIQRLTEKEFITVEKIKSNNNNFYFNKYSFPMYGKDFLMLKKDLLTQSLTTKEKGILIYLQLIAWYDTNIIEFTKFEEIGNKIGLSRQTTAKTMKRFLDKGQIKMDCFLYKCKYLAREVETTKDTDNFDTLIMD